MSPAYIPGLRKLIGSQGKIAGIKGLYAPGIRQLAGPACQTPFDGSGLPLPLAGDGFVFRQAVQVVDGNVHRCQRTAGGHNGPGNILEHRPPIAVALIAEQPALPFDLAIGRRQAAIQKSTDLKHIAFVARVPQEVDNTLPAFIGKYFVGVKHQDPFAPGFPDGKIAGRGKVIVPRAMVNVGAHLVGNGRGPVPRTRIDENHLPGDFVDGLYAPPDQTGLITADDTHAQGWPALPDRESLDAIKKFLRRRSVPDLLRRVPHWRRRHGQVVFQARPGRGIAPAVEMADCLQEDEIAEFRVNALVVPQLADGVPVPVQLHKRSHRSFYQDGAVSLGGFGQTQGDQEILQRLFPLAQPEVFSTQVIVEKTVLFVITVRVQDFKIPQDFGPDIGEPGIVSAVDDGDASFPYAMLPAMLHDRIDDLLVDAAGEPEAFAVPEQANAGEGQLDPCFCRIGNKDEKAS